MHGTTIDLDAAPSLPFEGKRVRVVLELDEDARLTTEEQACVWSAWLASGSQGPIEDDSEPQLP